MMAEGMVAGCRGRGGYSHSDEARGGRIGVDFESGRCPSTGSPLRMSVFLAVGQTVDTRFESHQLVHLGFWTGLVGFLQRLRWG